MMIGKLERYIREEDGVKISCPPDNVHIIAKINELCDAVNILQCKNVHIESDLQDLMYPKEIKGELGENMQDEFAEQRTWIGKLCKFRDYPACEWRYGILYKIYEDNDYPFWDTDCNEYRECEPVKPTDPIIYEGGNNE